MASAKHLLSTIESCLFGLTSPSPSQRMDLMLAIRFCFPSFQSLLCYPPPLLSDRIQVQKKEVKLLDSQIISLDDQDIVIALKLSDDLFLNELDCVQLLVSTNQESGLMGREPLEILRLAAGLWYTRRRDLITALYMLFRFVVLDQEIEADFMSDLQKQMEDLIKGGLRERLISSIKKLARPEPAGFGGPLCEPYVLDSRGTLVERGAVVCRERLVLGHCLVLSVMIVRPCPKDVKDVFFALKHIALDPMEAYNSMNHQVMISLLFFLIIALISDALSAAPDKEPILSHDASFRKEFNEIVMNAVNNSFVEGFVGAVRLAWAVHLMLLCDEVSGRGTSISASNDYGCLNSCLELIFNNNVFQFLLENVLRTAAYQNDEDMNFLYDAYLHKLTTCFLSHPLSREKVKESKKKAGGFGDAILHPQQPIKTGSLLFISLLEFVSEIYQKEPELLASDEVLWTFVLFAGEDHSKFETLVAFLKMLSSLACNQESAARIYDLLKGKTFHSVGWSTLFSCLKIYHDKFKKFFNTAGTMLPEIPEGDAQAIVAYLDVLRKVMESGHPVERKNWFLDIEPLFKLLGYENVPPYLKGALRNAIAAFINVSPGLKDAIWGYLEQHDLPIVVNRSRNNAQGVTMQIYDMQYELNEIEGRSERYPSTLSALRLFNCLIAEEKDVSDKGLRFIGIFRFISDHVFGPFFQRAYVDPCEKWHLAVACLQHFHMMLTMYDIPDDINTAFDQSEIAISNNLMLFKKQIPVLELLKDFMSGKIIFQNIMGIILPGVNSLIKERTTQIHGKLVEKAVRLCLEIIVLVFEKDVPVSDFLHPLYQSLDIILCQDHHQIAKLLEYIRYEFLSEIQLSSVRILNILSSRIVGLVQLLKSCTASSLAEDYAYCLELRFESFHVTDGSSDDPALLILQLLIDNVGRQAPNITHLLLNFDLELPIDQTILQPRLHYSCLKVILGMLDKLVNPDRNALLHEFGFQLLYELSVDPLTSCPTMNLMSNRKYLFFVKHVDKIVVAPHGEGNSNQHLRICSLHQRAWLLKLLAAGLLSCYGGNSSHLEACQCILANLIEWNASDIHFDNTISNFNKSPSYTEHADNQKFSKIKVLKWLDVIQFQSPDTATLDLSHIVSSLKCDLLVDDILEKPETGLGIYYYTYRGDRLIDLTSFSSTLWQKFNSIYLPLSKSHREAELIDAKEAIQKILRWGWNWNRILEEDAAQLHMLSAWAHVVEVLVCRGISAYANRSDVLYQILDASLSVSSSSKCSLKMVFTLNQVSLICMAHLRDEQFLCPKVLSKSLSNGACHSILLKLIMTILRNVSFEPLRWRQYALLLSYFQYCCHTLKPNIPVTVLQLLLQGDSDSDVSELQMIDTECYELARGNFFLLRKEAPAILDLVIKDAIQGSEPGKMIALYVLDALIYLDCERFFLNQLQSRGFLQTCLKNISNFSFQSGQLSLDSLQQACTFEAQLALLLRICHKYGKTGGQVLFSMGVLEHFSSCREFKLQGTMKLLDKNFQPDGAASVNRQQMIILPVLRFVFSLTSLINTSDIFEVNNKVVRDVRKFVSENRLIFDQILREDFSGDDDLTMDKINLVVGILVKVWPYEESEDLSIAQGLFNIMFAIFSSNLDMYVNDKMRCFSKRKMQLNAFHLCFGLSSHLYFLITKKSVRLQLSEKPLDCISASGLRLPTLTLLGLLLSSVTSSLETASEENSSLLNKIQEINELPKQEVDGILNICGRQESVSSSDTIQKRRYLAMVEMSLGAGQSNQLVSLLLQLVECILNILLIHFQDKLFYGSIISHTSDGSKTVNHSDKHNTMHDFYLFCEKLIPTLDQLALLTEGSAGRNLKLIQRLVSSVKEIAIKKLTF